ncbi:DUF4157 domain-containing protein [Autumnicola psychrophila]|uniref:DUF4157 domain-containing protein n=1 Tax=Autumnicola psychrophila TaxID=3075592 RepID=A0ABU3DU83_9FLAO|nr:DUF4157 domain-containing protein [Zunongwangia sp. F225]MDT0687014.1 DUF4157 domain-containing protein [Zunongwangia sp. F225]
MQVAETKTSSAANKVIQKKRQPFFNKEGQDSFFPKSSSHENSFFSPKTIQPKLTIGQPNDKYEVEADAMADKVVQRLTTRDVQAKNRIAVQAKPLAASITPLIQKKCTACEQGAEKPGIEEEDIVQESPLELQRKPIFESNANPSDDENNIQRKCEACDKEEEGKLQTKAEGSGGKRTTASLESRLKSTKGGGSALPEDIRTQMESSFGINFSGVRIHTNNSSVQMNKELNAQAITHGSDIYFNTGKYDPETTTGKHLLAHELTHTVQQGESIQKKEVPQIQRVPATDEEKLVIRTALANLGVRIDDEDAQVIHDHYPDGITPERRIVFVQIGGENYTAIARLSSVRLGAVVAIPGGAEIFVFEIGKGRAILLSSIGGQSIMLDAGAGGAVRSNSTAARRLATFVNNLTTSGLAAVPRMIKLSHMDADHYNAVSSVLNLPQMGAAVVEVTRQQLIQAMSSGTWNTMNVQIAPGQSIVQLNVTGTGIDVRKSIVGNMELTEFRSRGAHAALNTPGAKTFNKNNTSPVTVMRDLRNNSTYLFTGDVEGRLLNEVVNMVGENAMRRILGGGARNLTGVEFPHHGGAVNRGPDVAGMTRFLRLLFESSNGRTNFFTQTSQNFSTSESASIRYLDTAQIPVERIMDNPGETTGVRQISRGVNNRIVLNGNQIASVIAMGNTNSSTIMEAYQLRDRILNNSDTLKAMESTFRLVPGQGANLSSALGSARSEIETHKGSLSNRLNTFWGELATAAQTTGMRASANTAQLSTEVNNIQTTIRSVNLEGIENSIALIRDGINLMGRVFLNTLEMQQAIRERNLAGMNTLKTEQRQLVRQLMRDARVELGATEYNRQLRSAWRSTRAEWNRNYVQRVAKRMGISEAQSRKIAFRSQLAINLSRQMQLNNLARRAQEGQLGGTAPVAMRSRVGAGILAAIELLRIGFEFYDSYQAAEESSVQREREERIQGLREVYWWEEMGIRPQIKLIGETFWGNPVTLNISSEEAYRIINEEIPESQRPDYKKVVVDNVYDSDLKTVIAQFYIRFMTMTDWIEAMGNPELNDRRTRGSSNIWFLKEPDGTWRLKLWNSAENEYMLYRKNVIDQPLNKLLNHLSRVQDDSFNELKTEHAEEGTFTISDTAWFGVDRNAFVYNSYGNPQEIDFEGFRPTFVKRHTTDFAYRVRGQMALVQAANAETYRRLARYYWVVESRQTYIDNSGVHHSYSINPNFNGYAYVPNEDLIQKDAPTIQRKELKDTETASNLPPGVQRNSTSELAEL